MKKYTPYIFPLIVLSIVFLLIYRWHSIKNQKLEEDTFAEGIQIENLSEEELSRSISGVGDYSNVELTSQSDNSKGDIRYEIKDGEVRFSIIANLPDSENEYNVWLKEANGDLMREAFTLIPGKGGYIGSAVLPSELLPFEVIVSNKLDEADVLKTNILHGTIEAEGNNEGVLK